MVLLKCRRCSYVWDYQGAAVWYACCPKCHTNVKVLDEDYKEPEKVQQ